MTVAPEKITEWTAMCLELDRLLHSPGEPGDAARGFLITGSLVAAVPLLLSDREEALAVLRSVEWDAETDRCPSCKRLNPAAREPFENEQDYGHGPKCRLDALLRGTR